MSTWKRQASRVYIVTSGNELAEDDVKEHKSILDQAVAPMNARYSQKNAVMPKRGTQRKQITNKL